MPPSPASAIEPGQWVRHPQRPDWGLGQVQSAIGDRVTVNFEHAGKVLVNARVIALELAVPIRRTQRRRLEPRRPNGASNSPCRAHDVPP